MDIISLLTAGPSIIRGIGSLFGGDTKDVADKVANVADAITGKSPASQKEEMQRLVDSLPPEAMVDLKRIANEAQRIKNEARARDLEHEERHTSEMTTRIIAETGSDDSFVRRTRPLMARWSAAIGSLYALGFEGLEAFDKGSGADLQILAALLTPAVAYITGRSVDKMGILKGRWNNKITGATK